MMSQLTLRLLQIFNKQLIYLAENQESSCYQYIVYVLTRQIALNSNYRVQQTTAEELKQQQEDFQTFLSGLEQVSLQEAWSILEDREVVEPEAELTPDIVARFQKRIGSSKFPVIS